MKNLIYTVQNFRLNLGIATTQYDQQYLQWAIDELKILRDWNLLPEIVKSVKIPIDKSVYPFQANLPNDFIDYVRIGICMPNGTVLNFAKNDDLCLPFESCPCDNGQLAEDQVNCCNDALTGGWPVWGFPIWGTPYSFSYATGSYGVGPGNYPGGYKLDIPNGLILFDNCVRADHFIMEYFGDAVNDMGNALITDNMVRVLVNGMDKQRKRWSPDKSLRREYSEAYNIWYQSIRDLNSKQQMLNKHEWVLLFREYCYLGVKA